MAEDVAVPPASSPFQTLAENFAKLSTRQKIAGAVAIAAAIALISVVWMWGKQPSYAILFSNLSDKDGGAIVAALQQQNVPYKIDGGGSVILVPETMASEMRLKLAAQGLPKGGMIGFEVMDTQKIGLSQFNEQINYQRALEGELARTMLSISAVSNARVHLAIPKTNSFLRETQKPTASVVLTLYPGRRLEPDQISGIVHLVAASVPQLDADDVNVIDQNGKLLTRSMSGLRQAGLNPSQLNYVESLEDNYMRRIETILLPIVGVGNFRTQVTAEIDFDAQEQTSETYKPNPPPGTAIRSQQMTENSTAGPNATGVPGALTNQPPAPATAPITTPATPTPGGANPATAPQNSTKASTTNYELDKTISHVRRSLGGIKRLSVALVLNEKSTTDAKGKVKTTPLTADEIKKITELVQEAVGYDEKRGDTIKVQSTPFTSPEKEVTPDTPIWKNPEMIALGKELLRYAILFGILAFIVMGVIRPMMTTLLARPEEEAEKARESAEGGAEGAEAEGEEGGPPQDIEPELLEAELAKMSLDKKIIKAKEIAARDPKLVAQMIKEWMAGGDGMGGG